MVKNIKRQLSGGAEKIFLNEEPADDPGKCMEKAKYEVIPFAKVDGKKGKIKERLNSEEYLVSYYTLRKPISLFQLHQLQEMHHATYLRTGSLLYRLLLAVIRKIHTEIREDFR